MVLFVKLPGPYFKGFLTLFSSLGFRSLPTTKLAFNYRVNIARASSSSSSFTHTKMNPESYTFGPYKISSQEVFYTTDLSFAMVNLRPVLPGHILQFQLYDNGVKLAREVKRFCDLTSDEIKDLWMIAQKVGRQLEQYHKASSLTFTIQDGPQAGQTVPHVHIHIVPRKTGDFKENDEIYDAIDDKEKKLKDKLDLDKERKDRNHEEMALEADEYRKLLS